MEPNTNVLYQRLLRPLRSQGLGCLVDPQPMRREHDACLFGGGATEEMAIAHFNRVFGEGEWAAVEWEPPARHEMGYFSARRLGWHQRAS